MTLNINHQDQIAIITLNRPQCKNAMSFQMMHDLIAVAQSCRRKRELRAVVLHGSAHTFCSGLDLADLKNAANRKAIFWQLIKPTRSLYQSAALVWRDLPLPVIAAVEGHALGAGLQLALGTDYCIAAPNSQWAIREAHWGIIPDMGLSLTSRGRIRADHLAALTYSADLFSGEAAEQYGFVSELSAEPLDRALALAQAFSQRSPDALLAAKRLIQKRHGGDMCLLWREKYWQIKLLLGKNQAHALHKSQDTRASFLPRQFD